MNRSNGGGAGIGGGTGTGAGGANLLALRSHNTALVLDLLRTAGAEGISRLELAERTGLTPQAVSKITARLRGEGLATEAGRRASTGGKPRTVLRLVPGAGHALGVHLDRDELRAVLVDLDGRVVGERRAPLDLGAGAETVLEGVARAAEELTAEASAAEGAGAEGVSPARSEAAGPAGSAGRRTAATEDLRSLAGYGPRVRAEQGGPLAHARAGGLRARAAQQPGPSGGSGPVSSAGLGPASSAGSGPVPSAGSGPRPPGGSGPQLSGRSGPGPSGGSGPVSSAGLGPASSAGSGPEPSAGSGPRPPGGSGPQLSGRSGPGPSGGSGPEPSAGLGPVSSGGAGPVSSGGLGPGPSGGSGPEPSAGLGPVSSGGAGPVSSGGLGPGPSGGSGPEPSAGLGPVPSVGSGPRPPGGSGPEPSGGSGPEPSAGSGPEPSGGAGSQPFGGAGVPGGAGSRHPGYAAGADPDVLDHAPALLRRLPTLLGLGVALPGPLDHGRGVLHRVTGFPEWDGFPLRDALERRLGVPVVVDKDTNAAALGLAITDAGREGGSFAYLHLGTGLGAGLVFGGGVHRGARTGAGEFGHQVVQLDGPPCTCGDRGCIEALCLAAVARGDLAEAARVLGAGAANLAGLLDIDLVLLGGRTVDAAPEAFVHGVGAVLDARARREGGHDGAVPVRLAPGGARAVAEGAAQLLLAPLFGRGDGG